MESGAGKSVIGECGSATARADRDRRSRLGADILEMAQLDGR